MLKKKLKKAISIFQWLLTVVLVSVVLLLIFTAFNPVKSFQIFRVMSGSMEPKIKVGSVVFVQRVKPETLKEGNIITFTSREDPNISITHRLIATEEKEGQTVFKTRGDANNSDDITETLPGQIKGKVVFSLPFLGYLSVWIRKPLGFGLLVILPALLIIISEILNIKKTIEQEVEKKYAKQEKHSKNKPINLLLIFLLGIGLFQIKPTNAYFSDVVVVGGNTFSMGWWTDETAPESEVDSLSDYQNNSQFFIKYTASDDSSGVKEVRLYYQYNFGGWQLFGTDTIIDNKFQFTSPAGDGLYEFLTIATDFAGNIEDDWDGDGILQDDEFPLLADTSTTVDTTSPVTMFSASDLMAVANEQIYNGGFENGNLDGWTVDSNGSDHQVTAADKKTGAYSALIGFKTAASSAEPAYDSIKQSTTLPSWMTSTLSFWYRLLTESDVSGGFFDAFVTPTGSDPITVAHDAWDDPLLFDKDLDWKNVTYQLNGLEGKDIEIEFKVTQPYEGYKTWGYLDDVKVCAATNSAATTTDFSFSSHDGSGSDNSTTYYSTDNWSTSNTYSGTFSLPVGDNLLEYFSEDEAGNSETPKEINLTVQADPVDFGVVLNEFLPDPTGYDDALKPGGEWVRLYNNAAFPSDVNGWVLYGASDTHELVISASNSDNNGNPLDGGETVIPAGGILTVYRNGDGDFELNNTGGDTVRLYNATIDLGGMLIDSFTYKINTSGGKSFKREPNGIGGWKDPEVEPVVDFYLQKNKAAVGFKVEDVGQFNQLNYEISYKTNGVSQGIVGIIKIEGQNEITKEGFTLGTCSSGGTCVYHSGIKEIKLKITLTDQNNNQKILEKMINYE